MYRTIAGIAAEQTMAARQRVDPVTLYDRAASPGADSGRSATAVPILATAVPVSAETARSSARRAGRRRRRRRRSARRGMAGNGSAPERVRRSGPVVTRSHARSTRSWLPETGDRGETKHVMTGFPPWRAVLGAGGPFRRVLARQHSVTVFFAALFAGSHCWPRSRSFSGFLSRSCWCRSTSLFATSSIVESLVGDRTPVRMRVVRSRRRRAVRRLRSSRADRDRYALMRRWLIAGSRRRLRTSRRRPGRRRCRSRERRLVHRPRICRLSRSYPSGDLAASIAVYAGLVLVTSRKDDHRTARIAAWRRLSRCPFRRRRRVCIRWDGRSVDAWPAGWSSGGSERSQCSSSPSFGESRAAHRRPGAHAGAIAARADRVMRVAVVADAGEDRGAAFRSCARARVRGDREALVGRGAEGEEGPGAGRARASRRAPSSCSRGVARHGSPLRRGWRAATRSKLAVLLPRTSDLFADRHGDPERRSRPRWRSGRAVWDQAATRRWPLQARALRRRRPAPVSDAGMIRDAEQPQGAAGPAPCTSGAGVQSAHGRRSAAASRSTALSGTTGRQRASWSGNLGSLFVVSGLPDAWPDDGSRSSASSREPGS